MTLPSSGDISIAMVAQEIGQPLSQLGLGDSAVRTLANVQSGTISMSQLYGKSKPSTVRAYYGLSTTAVATEALILGLTAVDIVALPHGFTLTAGSKQYQYWASPVALGAVKFYDTESEFYGGWDGAHNNLSIIGPIILSVNSVPYYVYRTDFGNLGTCIWDARKDLNPNY